MQLELSAEECRELLSAMRIHLDQMEREISRTRPGARDFRKELRKTIDRLDSVRRKLEIRQEDQRVYA